MKEIKLTQEQIEIVEREGFFYSIAEPNRITYSKRLWNKYRLAVEVHYKDGNFHKAYSI